MIDCIEQEPALHLPQAASVTGQPDTLHDTLSDPLAAEGEEAVQMSVWDDVKPNPNAGGKIGSTDVQSKNAATDRRESEKGGNR